MARDDDIRVLHLVTAREIFFDQQIEILEKKGIDCTVCVVPGSEQIDGNMGSRRGIREYLQYLPQVRRELRRGEYDLIHSNYGLTLPYAATQFQLPVVLTLWGSDVIGVDGVVTKAFAWRADAVTVRSTEMRELIGRHDAHIVPSGVDVERFRPIDRSEARTRVGWDMGDRHVLFPYSPEYERKNFPLAKQVVDQVGKKLGMDITLQTISGVDHEEMPYYMNAADCVLLTSDHEGSPNTVKEAMACNVPVVSTDVGDVQERLDGVSPGGVGSNETELIQLVCEVLKSDGRSDGRKAVMDVSWDRIGDKIVDIYHSVL